jgi:hypothetical protein
MVGGKAWGKKEVLTTPYKLKNLQKIPSAEKEGEREKNKLALRLTWKCRVSSIPVVDRVYYLDRQSEEGGGALSSNIAA